MLVPVIGGLVNIPPPSGSSVPGLPVWMFDAADESNPDPGCFTTDNDSIASTTSIRLASDAKNGVGANVAFSYIAAPPVGSILIMVSATGQVNYFAVTAAVAGAGGSVNLTVSGAGAGNWSGDYTLSTAPRAGDVTDNFVQKPAGGAIADGTYTIVGPNGNGSFTTVGGIITAYTPNS